MTIDEKATAIEKAAIAAAYEFNSRAEIAHLSAIGQLAKACALLTSTSKEERELGKGMVRKWKNGGNL